MSSRERVAALLRHELPDRIGLYDHFWGETLHNNWDTQGYPAGVSPEEYFDFDLRLGCAPLQGAPFLDRQEVVEESAEWTLTRNGNGATLRYWKHKSGTPEHVDFDCTTPQRWEEIYKPPLLEMNPERVDIPATRDKLSRARAAEKYSTFSGLFVFEQLRGMLGDVVILEVYRDHCRYV